MTGYALGDPSDRENSPMCERKLLPASFYIIRVVMHSALFWAAHFNQVRLPAV